MSSQLGRADLLRIRAALDEPALTAAALLLGLGHKAAGSGGEGNWREGDTTSEPTEQTDSMQRGWAPVPFWAVVAQQSHSPASQPDQPRPHEQLAEPSWTEQPAPVPPPRIDSRQLALLRAMLWRAQTRRKPDMPRLVRKISQRCAPQPLPLAQQRGLGTVCVVLDRARRWVPWWAEQDAWVQALLASGITVELMVAVDGEAPHGFTQDGRLRAWQCPAVSTPVLLLGDAGAGGSANDRRRWRDLARQLASRRCRPLLLDLSGTQQAERQGWQPLRLQTPPLGTPVAVPPDSDPLETLVVLCSPLVRLEPGLAATLQQLLGAPATTLMRLWQHPAIASSSSVAATLQPRSAQRYRAAYVALCASQPELIGQVLQAVRSYRGSVALEIWYIELLALPPEAHPLLSDLMQQELEQAQRWVLELDRHRAAAPGASHHACLQRRFEHGMDFTGQPAEVREALSRHYRASMGDHSHPPAGYEPSAIAPPKGTIERKFHLSFFASENNLSLWIGADSESIFPTSPVTHLRSISGEVVVDGRSSLVVGEPGIGVPVSAASEIAIRSDVESLRLKRLYKPAWASAMGRDHHGLWCEISIDSEHERLPVRQRLRYCPPGDFWMGSPSVEKGRWDDEGPRHCVSLSQGFWLFDTPVTQALWHAVMNYSPSRFIGDTRPVECVSYAAAQSFIEEFNRRRRGLELSLPSEAQWEYACRAGSENNRYGPLDKVVWYESNSGRETQPVAQKPANNWGVYDTLGNVLEWCHDGARIYTEEAVVDPFGPMEGNRAVRGGAWLNRSRAARAAGRGSFAPHDGDYYLGFRCLQY